MLDFYCTSSLYKAASLNNKDAIEFLIENNADPREISIISGQRAIDITTNKEIKQILTEYTNNFFKIIKNPFSNFRYRVACDLRMSLHYLRHPNAKNFYQGFICNSTAELYFKNDGISKLIEICHNNDKEYEKYLIEEQNNNFNNCLICDCYMNEPNLCPICKTVSICNECIKNQDPIVNRRLQIHTNNCKTGIFNK
jgi:hypothetical protein